MQRGWQRWSSSTSESDLIVMGVDPGKIGGIAIINTSKPEKPRLIRMPLLEDRTYDIEAMQDILVSFCPDVLVIERVTRPAQLVRCMALFEGLGAAVSGSVVTVPPAVWKRRLGLIHQNKHASMELARNLYPHTAHELKRVTVDDGLAEALLIAHDYLEQYEST